MKTASGIIMSAPVAYPTQSDGRTPKMLKIQTATMRHGGEDVREAGGHGAGVESPRTALGRRRRIPLRLHDVRR